MEGLKDLSFLLSPLILQPPSTHLSSPSGPPLPPLILSPPFAGCLFHPGGGESFVCFIYDAMRVGCTRWG